MALCQSVHLFFSLCLALWLCSVDVPAFLLLHRLYPPCAFSSFLSVVFWWDHAYPLRFSRGRDQTRLVTTARDRLSLLHSLSCSITAIAQVKHRRL